MKKIINYIIVLGIIGSGLILGSCTKLEDKNYSGIIASEFNPTSTDIGALLAPAYASWRGVMWDTDWSGYWMINEITSDEYVAAAKPYGYVDGGVHRQMHERTWTSQNYYVTNAWKSPWIGISNCNRLMFQIESGVIPPNDAMIAELKVLRASFYYVLCDWFGNIPIVTKFDVPEGFLPEQSSRAEVYKFIVNEITSALPLLSEDRSAKTYGRFNSKWAANALLAKVYLNAKEYSGTAEWAKCLQACEAIIASGKFSLDAVQKNVFSAKNENSPEIIWAIPYDMLYTYNAMFALTISKENRFTFNMINNPSGGATAVPQYISTFNTNDLRYTKGWLYGQQYSSTGELLLCASGTLKGKPMFIINESPGIDSNQVVHGYRLFKWEIPLASDRLTMNNDYPFFRYADVLMMKAECLLRTGQADAAATIVSQIRKRSFPNNPELVAVTGAKLLGGSVYAYGLKNHFKTTFEGGADIQYGGFLDELGWEFAAEGRRRQDMIRFGVFHTKSWLSNTANNDLRKNIFPIPLEVLNTNPKLKQNPGY